MASMEVWQLPIAGLCKTPGALQTLLQPKNLAHFFKCMDSSCSFSSDDDDLFLVHLSAHRNRTALCMYCGYQSTSGARLVKHVSTAHSLRRVQCSLCLYRARSKTHLVVHAAVAHKSAMLHWYFILCKDITPPVEQPLFPDDINELFYYCVNGERHERVQTCQFRCLARETFCKHLQEKHSGREGYSCHLCKKCASSPRNLIEHYSCTHGFLTVQCLHCDLGHESEERLLRHVMEEHADQEFRLLLRSGQAQVLWAKLKILYARLLSKSSMTKHLEMNYVQRTAPQVELKLDSIFGAGTCQQTEPGLVGNGMPSSGGTGVGNDVKCYIPFPIATECDLHTLDDNSANQGLSGHRSATTKHVLQEEPTKKEMSVDPCCGTFGDKFLPSEKICQLQKGNFHKLEPLQQGLPTVQESSVNPGVGTGKTYEQGRKNGFLHSDDQAGETNVTNVAAMKMDPVISPAGAGIMPEGGLAIDYNGRECYICVCCKHRMSKAEYFQHMSSSHEMGFFCGHCEKAFKVAEELLAHLQRRHSEEQPYRAKRYWCSRLLDVSSRVVAAWKQRQRRRQKTTKQTRQPEPLPEVAAPRASLADKCSSQKSFPDDVAKLSICRHETVGRSVSPRKPVKRQAGASFSPQKSKSLPSGVKKEALEIAPRQLPASKTVAQSTVAKSALKNTNCCPKRSPKTSPTTKRVEERMLPHICAALDAKDTKDLGRTSSIMQSQTRPQIVPKTPASNEKWVETVLENGCFITGETVVPIRDSEDKVSDAVIVVSSDSDDELTAITGQRSKCSALGKAARKDPSEDSYQKLLSTCGSRNSLSTHVEVISPGIAPGQLPAHEMDDQETNMPPALKETNCYLKGSLRTCLATNRTMERTLSGSCSTPESKGTENLKGPSVTTKSQTRLKALASTPRRVARKSTSGNGSFSRSRKSHSEPPALKMINQGPSKRLVQRCAKCTRKRALLRDACSALELKGTRDVAVLSAIGQGQIGHQLARTMSASTQRRVARKSSSGNGHFLRSRKLCSKKPSCETVIQVEPVGNSNAVSCQVLSSDSEDEVAPMTYQGFSYYRLKLQPLAYSKLFVWDSNLRVPYLRFISEHNFQPRLLVRKLSGADLIGKASA